MDIKSKNSNEHVESKALPPHMRNISK